MAVEILITKTDKIIQKLKLEDKVKYIEFSPEFWEEWNKNMEEIRRDYRIKQAKSEMAARNLIINM